MHPGNHRLRHALDLEHQPRAGGKEPAVVLGLGPRLHLLEVVAGTEGLAGARQHHDARRFVGGNAVERVLQRRQHFLGQRVELGGAIERQAHHAAGAALLDQQRLKLLRALGGVHPGPPRVGSSTTTVRRRHGRPLRQPG